LVIFKKATEYTEPQKYSLYDIYNYPGNVYLLLYKGIIICF